MNLVVNFLTMLVSDEENGSVKRMLGICAEFERIAKVVLDKTEKESHSKRKRKPANDNVNEPLPNQVNGQASSTSLPDAQPMSMASVTFTPGMSGMTNPLFSPSMMNANVYSPPPMMTGPPMVPSYDANLGEMLTPPNGLGNGILEGQENSSNVPSPLNYGAFQQPFVPQDLWQMPMTLEWDWADMTNGFPNYDQSLDGVDGGIPTQ